MFKRMLLAGAAMGMATSASAEAPMAEADVSSGKISNQYICRLSDSVAPGNVGREAARAMGRQLGEVLHTYQNTIKGFAVRLAAQPNVRNPVAELRANNPNITSCVQDQIARAFVQGKPGGGSTAQRTDWGIARVGGPAGANSFGTRTAWVIDSGIDLDHPDLNTTDTRHRSFIRDSSPDDQNGHGTHVAGTIAAKNNSFGAVGVSPGAPVVAVRVLDRRGSGSYSGVIAGVDYVAAAGNGQSGDVANMSLGGPPSQDLDDAVVRAAAKGIHFTLAAGNESEDADNHSPARANGPNVYTVSSFAKGTSEIDDVDPWSSFSNFGPDVDYAEPGSSIYSTYKDGGYATLSGTSMAAPHLAGILMTGQGTNDGVVEGDPDGNADPIRVRVNPNP